MKNEASTHARVSAAILAGGHGSRMGGAQKALILVDGVPILARQLAVLRPLFAEIFVVANDAAPFAPFGVPVVPDRMPGRGPLMGILSALGHARSESVFVLACDMPFVTEASVRLVLEKHVDDPARPVVAGVAGRAEPLFACYPVSAAASLAAAVADHQLKLQSWLERTNCVFVPEDELRALDPELRFLRNLNTIADLDPPGRP